ncbi:MAG: hypothetical protein HY539_03625 [Deltaproteobacteria bacterium]|nr:hypothetical protein [Deltaproteobacteria bacterium]
MLALYDPVSEGDEAKTIIHLRAEVWLNHLGLEVIYRPIDKPLPPSGELAEYRGILTWFRRRDAVPEPSSYCQWLIQQMEEGRKVVVLEEPGVFRDARRVMERSCLRAFRQLGIEYEGQFSDNPFFFELFDKVPEVVEFERKLELSEGLLYSLFRPIEKSAPVFLKARRRDLEESDSVLVLATSRGGFVHPSYAIYEVKDLKKVQWRINPLSFFEEAFQTRGLPRPDTTTLNGRRIFFTHIDGDGFFNVSHLDNKSYSGEIIYEKILHPYENLPMTASFIVGYFDQKEYQTEKVKALYRKILSLPHLEVSSHAYAHPLVWKTGKLALKIRGYHYDPYQEITGSIGRLTDFLGDLQIRKTVNLFQWTGDCEPSSEVLKIPEDQGYLHLNGGDPRFDKQFDSYAFVSPLGILKSTSRQIYTAAPNENVYTNLWSGPYYGYEDVIWTYQNTEVPIRIKPVNVYYHFYSGERVASLNALQKVYEYALAQKIFPLFASDYVRIARDFFRVRIERVADRFRIKGNGALRTIRFDREHRNLDLERSRGVLGFQHYQGSLYVFLDESVDHEIYLTHKVPSRPYLQEASFHLKNWRGTGARIEFEKKGWWRSALVVGGLSPHRTYQITSGLERQRQRTDSQGSLSVLFKEAENEGDFKKVLIDLVSL